MPLKIGEETTARFTQSVMQRIREEIDAAAGREVFFAGPLDDDGLVAAIRVCARGHKGAVPAVFDGLSPRDVVIHNHPGGDLEPSEADLELAIVYSHNGHGVYIVDNDVTKVYVVVEPFVDSKKTYLDISELAAAIKPNSTLARLLPEFEVRPQQIEMMQAIANAFNNDSIAVVEAPTGVGKTLAYLLPAVLWAVRNRERVVISTRTINLQEQIVFKDIPLLQKCLDLSFSAVLVKGRSNYVCPRRLDRAVSEATLFDDKEDEEALKNILKWAKNTKDGSKSDLGFVPPREIWEKICSEADTCTAGQCQAQGDCFVTRARRDIAKADILVVNHHMLFSDLAIKKELGSFTALAVLPAFNRLIIDEAHHIEDSATEYLGVRAARTGSLALLSRFIRVERGQQRGLIPFISLKLASMAADFTAAEHARILALIDERFLPMVASARDAIETAFHAVRSYVSEHCGEIGRDIKWRLTETALSATELRDIHNVYVLPAAEELTSLAKLCTTLHAQLKALPGAEDQDESPLAIEIAQLHAYGDRLRRLADTLAESTGPTLEPNTVRWVEIDAKNPDIVRLTRCPLEIGEPLAEWVYPNLKSVALTSATLSVEANFDFLFGRIGLDRVKDRPVVAVALDSPFDFHQQVILCIPDDIVPPDDSRFADQSVDYIEEAIRIYEGHAFILFTSYGALNYAYSKLKGALRKKSITALKQGDATRTQLLDRFRSDVNSVLFATDSFWEGVDVAGEALQCVILPRLPFRVPTEPILRARAESIEQRGGNAFMEYTIPLAVIKFRQGFGRLIRRRSDRGAVVVLDSRIVKKRYGKAFLRSLPGVQLVTGHRKGVFMALSKFRSDG